MMKILREMFGLSLLATVTFGFLAPSKSSLKPRLSMVAIRDLPGAIAPTEFFDPLNLSEGKSDEVLKRWRESEIKHGRICMLAAVGFLTAESWNPLFGGRILGAAIYHFKEIQTFYPLFWILLLVPITLFEAASIQKGWKPWEERNAAGASYLRDDYVPGDLGFDPLGLRPRDSYDYNKLGKEFRDVRTKELQNGRLAMLGVAGMVAQELVDDNTLAAHLMLHGLGPAS